MEGSTALSTVINTWKTNFQKAASLLQGKHSNAIEKMEFLPYYSVKFFPTFYI